MDAGFWNLDRKSYNVAPTSIVNGYTAVEIDNISKLWVIYSYTIFYGLIQKSFKSALL